jgi:hypothetical protein
VTRAVRLALACYPPSWRERYGSELAELSDRPGAAIDLLRGAARAWAVPAGPRPVSVRRTTALGTVHISWCAVFVAMLVYLKQVNDPPLPGLDRGLSQPLWGAAKAAFFGGWALLLVGGTVLLARIAVPAARARQWAVLRPMLPALVLLVVVVGTVPFVGGYGYGAASVGAVAVILLWLALGFALVVAGAVGPVLVLRRSDLPADTVTRGFVGAVGVALAAAVLAVVTAAQAAALSSQVGVGTLLLMWGAVAVTAAAATSSTVSVARAVRAG